MFYRKCFFMYGGKVALLSLMENMTRIQKEWQPCSLQMQVMQHDDLSFGGLLRFCYIIGSPDNCKKNNTIDLKTSSLFCSWLKYQVAH